MTYCVACGELIKEPGLDERFIPRCAACSDQHNIELLSHLGG